MKKSNLLNFVIIILILISCSSKNKLGNTVAVSSKNLPLIPAGVDSALALEARKEASKYFVSFEYTQRGDSVYNYAKEYVNITEELYSQVEDKRTQLENLKQDIEKLKKEYEKTPSVGLEENEKIRRTIERIVSDSATIEIVTSLFDYYLEHCREKLEDTYQINPYNLNIIRTLAICYLDRGVIFKDSLGFKNSIEQLKRFLSYDRGYYEIYRDISENYFHLEDWQKAHEYACKANEIFIKTAYFNDTEYPIKEKYKYTKLPTKADPHEYFELLKKKAIAELKIYEGDSALASFNEAMILADTKDDSTEIKNWVKNYIYWDDRNVWAAEQKFIIIDSLISENYVWAKQALIDLLPKLRTAKARHELTWRLSILQYNFLKEYDEAAERLYHVIVEADTIKKIKNFYMAPADSMYKVYFKDCGQMFLDMGLKYRNEGVIPKATAFFVKDTTIDWTGRAKALIPLAFVITPPDNNLSPKERLKLKNQISLKLLKRAKDFSENLEVKEIDQLYQMMIAIFQQETQAAQARRAYQEWQTMRQQK